MSERGPKVLLGDDEAVLRQVLRARLTARGYFIHEASTGEDVLKTVPALQPDVIVLDIGRARQVFCVNGQTFVNASLVD